MDNLPRNLVKLFEDGAIAKELAQEYDCDSQGILRRLEEMGVEILTGDRLRREMPLYVTAMYLTKRKSPQEIAAHLNVNRPHNGHYWYADEVMRYLNQYAAPPRHNLDPPEAKEVKSLLPKGVRKVTRKERTHLDRLNDRLERAIRQDAENGGYSSADFRARSLKEKEGRSP